MLRTVKPLRVWSRSAMRMFAFTPNVSICEGYLRGALARVPLPVSADSAWLHGSTPHSRLFDVSCLMDTVSR